MMYEKVVRARNMQQVALDVLSYHSLPDQDDVDKLKVTITKNMYQKFENKVFFSHNLYQNLSSLIFICLLLTSKR